MARLPNELLSLICQHLDDDEDLKSLRLVCSLFAREAAPRVFHWLDAGTPTPFLRRVERQLHRPDLCRHVTTLAFAARSPYTNPHDFDRWYEASISSAINHNRTLCCEYGHHSLPMDAHVSEEERSHKERRREALYSQYPRNAESTKQAFEIWQSMLDREGGIDHLKNTLHPVEQLFSIAHLKNIVIADRGFHHEIEAFATDPETLFDPVSPALTRELSCRGVCEATEWLLEAAIRYKHQLRHLTIVEFDWELLREERYQRLFEQVLPGLQTLRLRISTHFHDYSGKSRLEADLRVFLRKLNPNIRELKLGFYRDEVTNCPILNKFLTDLHLKSMRTLWLNLCTMSPEVTIDLLDRHRSSLKEIVFTDLRNHLYRYDWRRVLSWLRDSAIPLDRFVMKGNFGKGFDHFLLIRGVCRKLSNDTMDEWFEQNVRPSSCIFVDDDGETVIYRPIYRHAVEDASYPEL